MDRCPAAAADPTATGARTANGFLRGLLLDGQRKSVQPMAEQMRDGNMQAMEPFHFPSLTQRSRPLPVGNTQRKEVLPGSGGGTALRCMG
ncbi:hypothetical protein CP969_01425 [Streptomyces viridosporus T7A]|uniref:Transposase IS701-like DDE domain-containing protein n=1 Tax=Streptomyces viridosporus T7A TaxID=665577 RepID=A0ABX6A8D2_STRVD|nr:transposase [Streptomyces viridosporus]QEU83555.1 hypothetical protein CP969_01425 [Streptomyces viridosporus T7A]